MMNKKGILWGQIIFILLNIVFFVVIVVFLVRVGSGALEKEQVYAKKIALIIDSGKPETLIVMNVNDAASLGRKSHINETEMFTIDSGKNLVRVKLSPYKPYTYTYFSDVDATLKLEGDVLSIILKERVK